MDYAGLKASISEWTHRADDGPLLDSFIEMAEAMLNRLVRHPNMEARAYATAASGWIDLPTDYLAIEELWVDDAPLQLAANDVVKAQENAGGLPRYYAIRDGQFRIAPAPSEPVTVEIVYRRRIPALSTLTPTNWLIEQAPDLYLMACLIYAATWSRDPRLQQIAQTQFNAWLGELNDQADAIRYGGAPLNVVIG